MDGVKFLRSQPPTMSSRTHAQRLEHHRQFTHHTPGRISKRKKRPSLAQRYAIFLRWQLRIGRLSRFAIGRIEERALTSDDREAGFIALHAHVLDAQFTSTSLRVAEANYFLPGCTEEDVVREMGREPFVILPYGMRSVQRVDENILFLGIALMGAVKVHV